MKLQYKATLLMFSFGTIILLFSLVFHDRYSHKTVLRESKVSIENLTVEIAQLVETTLKEKAAIAITMSSAPLIEHALLQSNNELSILSSEARKEKIESLNQKWMAAEKISDPFIVSFLTNPVAAYLKKQQEIIPGEYGEIFLTNKYGAMIASTGKLTTLAHAHKYWWIDSYYEGQGRIFFDDRGFDTSVQGYVIGVVVPVEKEGQVIGVLKCNINIMGSLKQLIQESCSKKGQGALKIVRSKGQVVLEQGKDPLSTMVPMQIVDGLRRGETHATMVYDGGVEYLAAYAPVPLTMGSGQFGFGGKNKSIDQYKGNIGEGWHTVIFRAKSDVVKAIHETTQLLVIIGFVVVAVIAVMALFLGKKVAAPITSLTAAAARLGKGKLDTKIQVTSGDEIGNLAQSFNKMVDNLKHTMASRDELLHEIEQREKAEEENEKLIKELQLALSEIKTLSGIVPICSYCKQIRDDKGYWNQVDAYVQQHTEAQFSHSICPICLKKHHPNIAENMES